MNQHGPDTELPSDGMFRRGFTRRFAPPPVAPAPEGRCPGWCDGEGTRYDGRVLCDACFGALSEVMRERALPLLPGGWG